MIPSLAAAPYFGRQITPGELSCLKTKLCEQGREKDALLHTTETCIVLDNFQTRTQEDIATEFQSELVRVLNHLKSVPQEDAKVFVYFPEADGSIQPNINPFKLTMEVEKVPSLSDH